MPKTNAGRAAHLIQAYIDSDNGKNANADVQYIQSMKTRYNELDEMEAGKAQNVLRTTWRARIRTLLSIKRNWTSGPGTF